MKVRAFPIYPDSGVPHDGDRLLAFHRFAGVYADGTQMCVQAVVTAAVPSVLDHDVFPIIWVAGHEIGVHDFSIGNRANFIKWVAVGVAMQRTNINSFMEAGVDDACRRLLRIATAAVLAALPRARFHAFIIAIHVLVKRGTIACKESVVIRRKNKIESADVFVHSENYKDADRCNKLSHLGFLRSPMRRQSFFIKSMSDAVRPEGI